VRLLKDGLAVLGAATATVLLVAGGVAVASGAPPTRKAPSLTSAEQKALRIVSVRASATKGAGLLVSVEFAGKLEQRLGRDGLTSALVAVVIHPKKPGGPTQDIATRGAGEIGQTLSRTASKMVGAMRDGRQMLFFIGGFDPGDLGPIEVKAFPAAPAGGKPHSSASTSVSAEFWEGVEGQFAAEEKEAESLGSPEELSTDCMRLKSNLALVAHWQRTAQQRKRELADLRKEIDDAIEKAKEQTSLGAVVKAGLLHGFLAPIGLEMRLKTGFSPEGALETWKAVLRGLKLDAKLVEVYADRNQKLIERLAELKGKYEGLLSKCGGGSTAGGGPAAVPGKPVLTQIHAVFNESEFTTFYKEEATDPQGLPLTYTWGVSIPEDPLCANGFTPNKPQVNEATWLHKDTTEEGACNHTKYDGSGSGHPGTVVVVVSNGYWSCAATFFGTQGPSGEAVSDGPQPQECQKAGA
jgi:hypothetical protein